MTHTHYRPFPRDNGAHGFQDPWSLNSHSLFQGTMTHMAPETMLNGVQSGAADV